MKKIDKLVLDAFIGPFLITFLVVVFILLNINMLKYFDDIIGKGLDASVLGQLFFYFAIFTVPTAMPLAVLLSTLIAFGNLGEHFELTAIKSAGISLIRILRPIFFFVLVLTAIAFYANNNLVPKAALEAYSLLYDIKQKKPALELRAGVFYRGIDNLSIKVSEKFPEDEQALKGVIVYDHRKNDGNKEVTIADSGRMYTILNERYLKFELFNGYNYIEGVASESGVSQPSSQKESISRSKFKKTQVVFDLSSFKLQTTDKKWFQGNRIMRNISELQDDMDSLKEEVMNQRLSYYLSRQTHFTFYKTGDSLILPPEISRHRAVVDSMNNATYLKKSAEKKAAGSTPDGISSVDTTRRGRNASELRPTNDRRKDLRDIALRRRAPAEDTTTQIAQKVIRKSMGFDSLGLAKIDSIFSLRPPRDALQGAANTARQIKSQITNSNSSIENYQKELVTFQIQWHKIWASSFACIAMFLIGAPLGAIIKKGGLGVPFLVSIFFFIIYYVFTMQGEKLAKQNTLGVATGVWVADAILFCVGLIFLRQARIDARLFEADFYSVLRDKVKRWVGRRKEASAHPG